MRKSLLLTYTLLLSIAGWSQTIDQSSQRQIFRYAGITEAAPAPGGGAFIAGSIKKLNGDPAANVVKLNSDGTIDEGFRFDLGPDVNLTHASKVIPHSDGKLLVLGEVKTAEGLFNSQIFRVNADGTPDNSFRSSLTQHYVAIYDVGMQSDGKVIVVAFSGASFGDAQMSCKRLNTNGALDNTFTAPAMGDNDYVNHVEVLPDDKIILAGQFLNFGSHAGANNIVRLNANGSFDSGFDADLPEDTNAAVSNVWRMSDGTMFIDPYNIHLMKIEADGSPDASFDPDFDISSAIPTTILNGGNIVTLDDGNIIKYDVTGAMTKSIANSYPLNSLTSYDGANILAASINLESDPMTTHVIVDSDLNIVRSLFGLGVVDELPGVTGAIIKQADGKLIVKTEGNFYSDDDGLHIVANLFRLNADLSFDDSFSYTSGFGNYLELKFVDSDGRIYINNKMLGDEQLYRLTATGSMDGSFTPIPGHFNDLAELPDSQFIGVTGVPLQLGSKLVKFNNTGTIDPAVAYSATSGTLMSVDLVAGGGMLVTPNGGSVIKLKSDGTVDANFTGSGVTNTGMSASSLSDGKLFVVGQFYKDNDNFVWYPMASWDSDGPGEYVNTLELRDKIGVDLIIDGDSGYKYLLSQDGPNSTSFELIRLKTDNTIDKRFLPVVYEGLESANHIFLLNDKSLVIGATELYHVVLPSSVPEGAKDTELSLTVTGIKISWSDNSDNESVFEIERSTDGGDNYTLIASVRANITTYDDPISADGTYTYRVIAANAKGAAEPSDEQGVEFVTTGLLESERGFKVFPNPVKHQVQIQSNENIERFSIFQTDGRLMERSSPGSNDFQINMSGYASGLYVLQLESFSGKRTIKIFKQ